MPNLKESAFQSKLIKDLKSIFPGCLVMKLDSSYIQGIPDLLILYKNKWGILECKRNSRSHIQPNQQYYVDKLDEMSFSRFIFPENRDQVLEELKSIFLN